MSEIKFKKKKKYYFNIFLNKKIFILNIKNCSLKCNRPRRQMGLGHQDLNLVLKPLCCGASIGEGRQGREI